MRYLAFLLALPVLAACDSGPKTPPDLVQTQRQAMEKAKGVEQVLEQSAGERRERKDKAE